MEPSALQLSEPEEREARRIEKALREISTLEERPAGGAALDAVQARKFQRRQELEASVVMSKLRLGWRRRAVEAPVP